MTENMSSAESGKRGTRHWSPAHIASLVAVGVGIVALSVNLVLVTFDKPGTFLLKYDLGADIVVALAAGIVFYNVLRLEARNKQRALDMQRNEEQARKEQARVEAIEAERGRLIQIMDTIPHGVCIIKEDYEMDYVNPVIERAFGNPGGRKCYEYLNGLAEPCSICPNAEVFAGQTIRREWVAAKTGRIYELVDSLLPGQGNQRLKLEMLHDVTEEVEARKQAEALVTEVARRAEEAGAARAEAERHAEELEALLDISRGLTSTLQTRPLLDLILRALKQVVDYSNAVISIVEGNFLVIVAHRGLSTESPLLGRRVRLFDAVGFHSAVAQGKPVIIPDLNVDEPLVQAMRQTTDPMIWGTLRDSRAWMGVPLFVQDRAVGFLRLAHVQAGYYTERHAELAVAIASHAGIALENARLYEQAHKVARLEERQRMAGELHDSVSQALYAIALGTHAAREQIEQAPERLSGTLEYVLSLAETAVTEMRSLVFELHPESLEQLGLVMLLTKLVEAVRARDGIAVRLDLGAEPSVSLETKEMLYRIAQEALRNISKHANASSVEVIMCREATSIVLHITDNGVGFDMSGEFPGHYGLQSMAERAGRLGGTLKIESAVGQGTRVTATAPVAVPVLS
jgi:signal transduction histidine kinase/PAS domain-containing protein